jgi:carboxylate-amine ligase
VQPPSLTLGIEEEYQVVDPTTGELESYISELLEDETGQLDELHPEMHASTVEVATPVCETVQEARDQLIRLRGRVSELADEKDLAILAAGSHPISSWEQQEITPLARYKGLQEEMGEVAQRMLAFGLHVHVGIEDRDFLVDAMNVARYFLPHVLCLTTSSPFWSGRDTGFRSYRSVVWENFPRTGIPPYLESWSDYQDMVSTLAATGCIEDGTKIWWDARPNWNHPTLEFRICDACTRIDEAICVAAIFQALVAKLWKLRRENLTFRLYPKSLLNENKWRAVRYGLDGKLIDFGRQRQLPARVLVRELVDDFLDDVVDELGVRDEVAYAHRIMEEGTSAHRQLAVHRETGQLTDVVERLVEETLEGVS